MAPTLCEELLFLIIQFCHEEGLDGTAHMLEQETRIFFNLKYFEERVVSGDWNEAERYLSAFMSVEQDKFSFKIYFEIRKQKFLEALDESNRARALDILLTDLKVFAASNQGLYDDMTRLLTLDNFRSHRLLASYGDAVSARKMLVVELKALIEASPLFRGKLKFPDINQSRLRRLINQSLNWQHTLCKNPQPEPDMRSLFEDHRCSLPGPYDCSIQSIHNDSLPSIAIPASVSHSVGQQTSYRPTINESVTPGEAIETGRPINPDATVQGVKDSNGIHRSSGNFSMVQWPATALLQTQNSVLNVADHDFPKTVGRIFELGSSPTSMHFHPVEQTILLVGTNVGDIELWDVISGRKLLTRKFGIWNRDAIAMSSFSENNLKDPQISVNRTLWSPDGSLFGVAFSKQIVQLHSYLSPNKVHRELEINAHVGGVNDIAFSLPLEKHLVITCGDDKLIKVWDMTTGAKQHTFEGHGAPVYSLCSHRKEHVSFLFSTSTNGEIKAWLYYEMVPMVSHDAPALCCVRMAYTADGKRLYSCGTNKDGESRIVEWSENEGSMIRTYQGLSKRSAGDVLSFDISKSRFLAAGDDHVVKVWDIDNIGLLTSIDADGDLPENPNISFNKESTFLAVFANHNQIKILANSEGLQLLKNSINHSAKNITAVAETSEQPPVRHIPDLSAAAKEGFPVASNTRQNENTDAVDPKEPESSAPINQVATQRTYSVLDAPSQCKSLRLPCDVTMNKKISGLTYTNAGNEILALAESGIHLLWKPSTNASTSAEPTASFSLKQWQVKSESLTSDSTSPDKDIKPCFTLSRNDHYVVSASIEGAVSLYHLKKFQRVKDNIRIPAAATCFSLYPYDNNIVAIGMANSLIQIYHLCLDKLQKNLKSHNKSITGLAFSHTLNVLISSGQDAQIVLWDTISWKKKKSIMVYTPNQRFPSFPSHIQFHQDRTHFLSVHATHLAIYEAKNLECINQWVTGSSRGWISHATFSSDSQLVYASFQDGKVLIFSSFTFDLRCEINPSAYLPSDVSPNVYPLVVAAHPQKQSQFALGLSDGSALVIQPLESEGKWGLQPPVDDESPSAKP